MFDDRRNFLKNMGALSAGALFPYSNLQAHSNEFSEGYVIHAEKQETYLIGPRQAPVTLVVTKNQSGIGNISFCFEDIIPNDGIPVHRHLNEDELIYISSGTGMLTLGEKQIPVKAGSAAFIPKNTWHGIQNTGNENIRMMFNFTPSGFENYFREIGVLPGKQFNLTRDQFNAIDKKYGIEYRF